MDFQALPSFFRICTGQGKGQDQALAKSVGKTEVLLNEQLGEVQEATAVERIHPATKRECGNKYNLPGYIEVLMRLTN